MISQRRGFLEGKPRDNNLSIEREMAAGHLLGGRKARKNVKTRRLPQDSLKRGSINVGRIFHPA